MKNIPEKIYLQVGDEFDELADDFKELSEVSWHSEKIYKHDIEYVLATQTAALQNRVKELEREPLRFAEWLFNEYDIWGDQSEHTLKDSLQRDYNRFKAKHNL